MSRKFSNDIMSNHKDTVNGECDPFQFDHGVMDHYPDLENITEENVQNLLKQNQLIIDALAKYGNKGILCKKLALPLQKRLHQNLVYLGILAEKCHGGKSNDGSTIDQTFDDDDLRKVQEEIRQVYFKSLHK